MSTTKVIRKPPLNRPELSQPSTPRLLHGTLIKKRIRRTRAQMIADGDIPRNRGHQPGQVSTKLAVKHGHAVAHVVSIQERVDLLNAILKFLTGALKIRASSENGVLSLR